MTCRRNRSSLLVKHKRTVWPCPCRVFCITQVLKSFNISRLFGSRDTWDKCLTGFPINMSEQILAARLSVLQVPLPVFWLHYRLLSLCLSRPPETLGFTFFPTSFLSYKTQIFCSRSLWLLLLLRILLSWLMSHHFFPFFLDPLFSVHFLFWPSPSLSSNDPVQFTGHV